MKTKYILKNKYKKLINNIIGIFGLTIGSVLVFYLSCYLLVLIVLNYKIIALFMLVLLAIFTVIFLSINIIDNFKNNK